MGARIGKTFIFMCIVQNMLRYYITQITNVDPLKQKFMKLTYTWKKTFNINGTIIHSKIVISFNKNIIKLNALSDERHDIFIKTFD
jgi:translation initiation factor 1 (eIF-1/SUI1)